MVKVAKFFNEYGKYLFAFQIAVTPCSKRELDYMIKMFRSN